VLIETRKIDGDDYRHVVDHKEPCRSCHECEGGDHHWMPMATDDDEPDMVMVCKHCPVWRDISDAEIDQL
jgi:hypothetical protein